MLSERIVEMVRNFAQNGMKLLLEHPANVHDLLRIGRAEVLDVIDFQRMKSAGSTFVGRDYRHVEADIVLTAPLKSRKKGRSKSKILIYILIEHQSEPDILMALRLLEYVVQVYKFQVRQWSQRHSSVKTIRLYPVLPVVFYTGTRRWESIGQLADVIEMSELFGTRIPIIEPLYLNLSAISEEALQSEGGCFGQVLRLVQQRRAEPAAFESLLQQVVQQLGAMPDKEHLRWLELLSYISAFVYHERHEDEHRKLHNVIERFVQNDEDRKEIAMTFRTGAEALREEGAHMGELRASRKTLLMQLRQRFGKVPKEIKATIEATTELNHLEKWLKRVITADSLEDVGINGAQ